MKMTKKVFSAIAMAAMLATTAVPVTRVEAAVSPIAAYDFENGTGMSASGIAGSTAPSVVQDAERGNVLKFASGTSSKLVQKADDSSLGDYDMKINPGTPSSLKFTNPFSGKSLSGATVSMWVKVPDDTAASVASGLIGFVSGTHTIEHPDKLSGDEKKQHLDAAHGPFMLGVTCAYIDPMANSENPIAYFAGLHHNTYNLNDEEGVFKGVGGKWQYVTITMTNANIKIYVDGSYIAMDDIPNKRFNDGDGTSDLNKGQPKIMEFLGWSDTAAYVGYTGFSPTSADVCIDDLTLYDKELSAADVSALYQTAKTGSTVPSGGGNGGGSNNNDDAAAKAAREKAAADAAAAAAAAEAAAVEANKNLTNAVVASINVKGMPSSATKSVVGVFRGEAGYTALQASINGVTLKSGYRMADFVAFDLGFGGTQPEAIAKVVSDVPSGFDTNNMAVVRINDDGSVSILDYAIEDGKIVAKTNHFSKFAIVKLEAGVYTGSSSSNLPKTGVASTGTVVAVGAACVLGGAILLKKKKEQEA